MEVQEMKKTGEKEQERKPAIIVAVDNHPGGWCWKKTADEVAYCLPEYEFMTVRSDEFAEILKHDPAFLSEFKLAWLRGYSNFCMTEKTIDNMPIPFISTLATGGEKLETRLDGIESTAKFGAALIVQNRLAYHAAKMRGHANVHIIPNGVDIRHFSPADHHETEKLIVGCAANTKGSRSELKGLEIIVQSCEKLGAEFRNVCMENQLTTEQMTDFYRGLDFYFQPSHSEGCSNSVMEAMSTGLPVFICDGVGYHGEVCRSGIDYADGQVVFVERDPVDVARKARILLKNPEILNRIKINALKFAAMHEWKHIARMYKVVFESAMRFKLKKEPKVDPEQKQKPDTSHRPDQPYYIAVALDNFEIAGKKYKKDSRYQIPGKVFEQNINKFKK